MAATIRPPDQTPSPLVRFDVVERVLHSINATLFGILVLTGATLYLEPLGAIVGRRALVEEIHLYAGLALPVPVILAVCGPWGRGLREDLVRLNRWTSTDRRWFRAALRSRSARHPEMAALKIGKFNPGQKLNAAFVAGAGLVMLGTGLIMRWYRPWPLNWRTGATFVHDWLALGLALVIVGHIGMALRDPDALKSIVSGTISRDWASRHAPMWLSGDDVPGKRRPSFQKALPDGPGDQAAGPGDQRPLPQFHPHVDSTFMPGPD
jgi:formate dehydrogenase subunit gamma